MRTVGWLKVVIWEIPDRSVSIKRGESKMRRIGRMMMGFILVGIFLAGVPATVTAEKVKYNLGWIPYGLHVGFFGSLGEGYYKKYNIDVEWQRGFGAPDTAKRVAVGQFLLAGPLYGKLGG